MHGLSDPMLVSSNEKLNDQLNSYLELLSSLKSNELLLGADSVIDLNQFIANVLSGFKQEIKNLKIHGQFLKDKPTKSPPRVAPVYDKMTKMKPNTRGVVWEGHQGPKAL